MAQPTAHALWTNPIALPRDSGRTSLGDQHRADAPSAAEA